MVGGGCDDAGLMMILPFFPIIEECSTLTRIIFIMRLITCKACDLNFLFILNTLVWMQSI